MHIWKLGIFPGNFADLNALINSYVNHFDYNNTKEHINYISADCLCGKRDPYSVQLTGIITH